MAGPVSTSPTVRKASPSPTTADGNLAATTDAPRERDVTLRYRRDVRLPHVMRHASPTLRVEGVRGRPDGNDLC